MAILARVRKTDGVRYFLIDFRDQDGRRVREVAGTTRTQARDLLTRRLGEVRARSYVNPRDASKAAGPSFDEFADRFLREYAVSRRSDYYLEQLRCRKPERTADQGGPIRRYFSGKALREITAGDLDRYRTHCTQSDRVGPSTTRKRLTILGTMFRHALRWGVVDANPAADLEKPSDPKHKVRFLSPDEWTRLRAVAPPWLAPILRLAITTGMRRKEITGLRWEDVNLADRMLHVCEDSKTGTRAIPLGGDAWAVLEAQRERRREVGREVGRLSPYVFTNADGNHYHTRLGRSLISNHTRGALKSAGIADASFHTLRHSAASLMVQAGVSLYEVQRILGHSTPTVTQRYAHLHPEHLRGAVARLDSALAGVVDTQVDTGPTVASYSDSQSRASANIPTSCSNEGG